MYARSLLLLAPENQVGKKGPSITLSQLRTLNEIDLPLRHYDIETAIDVVRWIQARNHRAYLSHRKKNLEFET